MFPVICHYDAEFELPSKWFDLPKRQPIISHLLLKSQSNHVSLTAWNVYRGLRQTSKSMLDWKHPTDWVKIALWENVFCKGTQTSNLIHELFYCFQWFSIAASKHIPFARVGQHNPWCGSDPSHTINTSPLKPPNRALERGLVPSK